MFDILSIVLGRFLLGSIGFCFRQISQLIPIRGDKKVKSRKISFDDYENIIAGFKVILLLVFLFWLVQTI